MSEEPYYGPRPDVARVVPGEARVVFDVGCGSGLLGEALIRQRPGLEVYGVEPGEVAEVARSRLTDVARIGAEAEPPRSWPVPDVLVFADVLEHLVDPWSTLAAWRSRCALHTTLVVSVPNVAHVSALVPLLSRGRWDYAPHGVLDRTHLRFFTRGTAIELVRGAGFSILEIHRNLSFPASGWVGTLGQWSRWWWRRSRRSSLDEVRSGVRLVDFFTLQYLLVARPADAGGSRPLRGRLEASAGAS